MMQLRTSLPSLLTLALASGFVGGCAQVSDNSGVQVSPIMLEQENGGQTTTDEAPSFNDPGMEAIPHTQERPEDTTLTDAMMRTEMARPEGRVAYRVLVLWGDLPRGVHALAGVERGPVARPIAADPTTVTDWSGVVRVPDAVVGLQRTVRFDQLDRVLPRPDRATVAFVSHTQPHVDGLVLNVLAPAPDANLEVHTRAMDGSVNLALAAREGVVRMLPDGQNGIAVFAHAYRPDCAGGMLFGEWRSVSDHLGFFRGRSVDRDGPADGALRGIFGTRRDGTQVLFGKQIDRDGRYDALLGGTYGEGRFQGRWRGRDGAEGELHGRYFDGPEANDGRGFFVGRWQAACR